MTTFDIDKRAREAVESTHAKGALIEAVAAAMREVAEVCARIADNACRESSPYKNGAVFAAGDIRRHFALDKNEEGN